jgi:hypothetical protein
MKIVDLFTNAGKEEESDVNSPALSLTKVQAGHGAGSGAGTASNGDSPKADAGAATLVADSDAELEGDKVTLIALREGRAMDPAPTFQRP